LRRSPPTVLVAVIDQVTEHAGAAIAVVGRGEIGSEMRKMDHVLPLTATGRLSFPGIEPALADARSLAHPTDGQAGLFAVDQGEPHRLPSLAKNIAVGSTGQRNRSFKDLSRRLEPKSFPGLILRRSGT
jgi:hypothetical protein